MKYGLSFDSAAKTSSASPAPSATAASSGSQQKPLRDIGNNNTNADFQHLDWTSLKNNSEVEMIEAKTEDGGTRLVPYHKKGSSVLYKSPQGVVGALILDVHLDGLLEPYYTLKVADGGEKQ